MNICQAPSASAMPNTAKASQKWPGMGFLLPNTAQPPAALRAVREVSLVDHLDLAPHALVAEGAKLLVGHYIVAALRKAHELFADVAWHQDGVDVGALDEDAVDDVGAGGPQRD